MVSIIRIFLAIILGIFSLVNAAPWGDWFGDLPARNGQNIYQCDRPSDLPSINFSWGWRFLWHHPISTIKSTSYSYMTHSSRTYQLLQVHFRGGSRFEPHRRIDMTYWQDTGLMYVNYKWGMDTVTSRLPQAYILVTWMDASKNSKEKMIIHLPGIRGSTSIPVEYDCKTGIGFTPNHAQFEIELYVEP